MSAGALAERFPSTVPFTVVGVLEYVQTAGAPARGVEQRNLNNEILTKPLFFFNIEPHREE